MGTFSIADLFFVITACAVIIITAFLLVALFYFIIFLRSLIGIAQQAGRATKFVVDDLGDLSRNIRREGFRLGSFIKFLFGMQSKSIKKVKELPNAKVKTK